VAEQLGFSERARPQPVVAAPLPDYRVPAVRDERWSTGLAGAAGTLVVFGVLWLAGTVLRRRPAG
jgi:hypothetical protein